MVGREEKAGHAFSGERWTCACRMERAPKSQRKKTKAEEGGKHEPMRPELATREETKYALPPSPPINAVLFWLPPKKNCSADVMNSALMWGERGGGRT